MSYTREPFQLIHHQQETGSWGQAAAETMWNKMILAPVVDALNNRDFYGYELYDSNAPWYQRWAQEAKSIAGDAFNPITITGADKAKETGGGLRDQALAYAGFGPAPAYLARDPVQNRIMHMYQQHVQPEAKPYGEKAIADERRAARSERFVGLQQGDMQAAQEGTQRLLKTGMAPNTVAKMQYGNADVYFFSKLPHEDQSQALKMMDENQFRKYVMGASPVRGKDRIRLINEWKSLHP